ncbi:GTPase-activating protein [Steccherinum ochraceum]|uniref:GTPase-activating protein n=1 Tax=Steccherinum ochraceum TaxID=92696 RepID=A0A4R0RVH9_9APHY|nr:GTPase-activating protein [Steccherinum ochraceum]
MAARPPPARPHIGFNPSGRFSSYSTSDWVDDDAWDSGSDSESPTKSQWKQPPNAKQGSSTSPKPVPKSGPSNSSSSTLASSYTHLHAPSPSSYPPRAEQAQATVKNGWTIVRKSTDQLGGTELDETTHTGEGVADVEADGSDLILGDMDPDVAVQPAAPSFKPRQDQGSIRDDVDEIVNDPLHLIRQRPPKRYQSLPSSSTDVSGTLARERSIKSNRRQKFVECITQEDVNMAQLRKLAWNGVPPDLRPVAWPLLLGYMPLPAPLRASTLARKRQEYQSLVDLAFARNREGLDQQIWHQIEIDVPRTRPGVKLWMHAATQRSLERILYVWAIRHPASGYVQGINDLATPFFQVFLSAYIDSDPEEFDPTLLPSHVLNAIEADSFWCLSRLLDGIQDNYIASQPGIQRSVKRMTELVARIDPPLAAHLDAENVEFMQFAFRWMNCLLMREISVQNTIRMWDTYLFHLYVCSAFLVRWSKKLREMDFQGIIMFLQSLPTQGWTDHEIEMLLSEAFVHYSTWHNAQSHFGK